MFTRWIHIILLVLILLPGATLGAQADNDHEVICGDLAESDCQILKDNLTAMESVDAFTFSMSMMMVVAHGDLVSDTSLMSLALEAQGSISIDPMTLAGIMELDDQIEASPSLLDCPKTR